MQLQDGIGLIIFVREQHTDLKAFKILFHLRVLFLTEHEDILVHVFLQQIAALLQVMQGAFQLFIALDDFPNAVQPADHRLRLLRIVPEILLHGLCRQLFDLQLFLSEVKVTHQAPSGVPDECSPPV